VTAMDPAAVAAGARQLLADAVGYVFPAALRVAVRTEVADHLRDGPKSPEELAALCAVQPDHIKRVLRLLATRQVFRENDEGRFELTPTASLLCSGSPVPVRSLVQLFTDELYWLPAGRLEDTVRKGTPVFDDIFGMPCFEYLATDVDGREEMFSAAMVALSQMEKAAVAASYDFPEKGTVVDVGGGRGALLREILLRNPGLHGVLFDLESVLRGHELADPAIDGRWKTVAGDFFTAVPAGADRYLFKRILHDWDDDACVRMLRRCREAMAPTGRVLVIDTVVPPGNDYDASKVSDLVLMVTFNGKERTREELAVLFASAGLRLERVIPTPGTVSIVEGVPSD
jgi:hypothetical protein